MSKNAELWQDEDKIWIKVEYEYFDFISLSHRVLPPNSEVTLEVNFDTLKALDKIAKASYSMTTGEEWNEGDLISMSDLNLFSIAIDKMSEEEIRELILNKLKEK